MTRTVRVRILAGRQSFDRVMSMDRYTVIALLGILCLDSPRVLAAKGTPLFATWPKTTPCVDVFGQLNHANADYRVDALTGHGSGCLPIRWPLTAG